MLEADGGVTGHGRSACTGRRKSTNRHSWSTDLPTQVSQAEEGKEMTEDPWGCISWCPRCCRPVSTTC